MIIIILTATAFGQDPSHTPAIIAIHVLCWIAQFVGHGFAEKRAPALLDNLLGGKTLFLITPHWLLTYCCLHF